MYIRIFLLKANTALLPMTHLNLTCLLLGTVPLSLFAALIPAAANDAPPIPVEAVLPLESPTGTVHDLGTITPINGEEWYWEKPESGEKTNTGDNLKLPEPIKLNSEEVGYPEKATPNLESWGNTGERRRRGPTFDLTEF